VPLATFRGHPHADPASTAPEAAARIVGVTSADPVAAPAPARLFAYGTLMTGFSRRPLLGDAVLEGLGRIRGSLYHFGDYPGVVLDDRGWVAGELYRVLDLPERLPVLDRAEWCDPEDEAASLYVRRTVPVRVPAGDAREAWIYVYNERFGLAPARGPLVESGDWRAHLSAREQNP
jgi:gamma-glutamylcyclotransferase (GGCT)/AIG2-like uncharacterized protein YtfP